MILCGVSGCVVYAGQGRGGRKSWGCQTSVLRCNSRKSQTSLSVKTAISHLHAADSHVAGYRRFDEVLGRSAYTVALLREVDVGMLLGVVALL